MKHQEKHQINRIELSIYKNDFHKLASIALERTVAVFF